MEYIDKLNNVGLYFEAAIADRPATDQPMVTKKRVVECLQQIGQQELAEILIKSQGKIFIKNKLCTVLALIIRTAKNNFTVWY